MWCNKSVMNPKTLHTIAAIATVVVFAKISYRSALLHLEKHWHKHGNHQAQKGSDLLGRSSIQTPKLTVLPFAEISHLDSKPQILNPKMASMVRVEFMASLGCTDSPEAFWKG